MVEGNGVESQELDQLKETNIDDNVVDDTYLHPIVLASPVHDCAVLGNQVAMEMQEPINTSHNKRDELEETAFVANGNNTDPSSVITNKQCKPDYKPPSPTNSKSDEPRYKPPSSQRDALFPMRDQKSLLEIKQVSVRGCCYVEYLKLY